jgi:hypothetical protein
MRLIPRKCSASQRASSLGRSCDMRIVSNFHRVMLFVALDALYVRRWWCEVNFRDRTLTHAFIFAIRVLCVEPKIMSEIINRSRCRPRPILFAENSQLACGTQLAVIRIWRLRGPKGLETEESQLWESEWKISFVNSGDSNSDRRKRKGLFLDARGITNRISGFRNQSLRLLVKRTPCRYLVHGAGYKGESITVADYDECSWR